MKKITQSIIFFMFLALFSILVSITSLATVSTVQVFVDGMPLITDQPAVIRNDRTMVPFNAIFSALGASVIWDEKEQKVIGVKGELSVELYIDKTTAKVNGNIVEMDTKVQLINGRTMVPLKFVSSYLGASVNFENYVAYVSTSQAPDIFSGSIPIIEPEPLPVTPIQPITPTLPLFPGEVDGAVPTKDTAPKSNILAGTYVAENIKGNRFAIQFNSSMTADIKNISTGASESGLYNLNGINATINSNILSGSFTIEELNYNGRKIILFKDISQTGDKTLAITPVSYEEFAKFYLQTQ